MVIALLRAKPDVNLQDKVSALKMMPVEDQCSIFPNFLQGGLTALRMAAENGHFDVVNALLVGAPEIDVNRQDKVSVFLYV